MARITIIVPVCNVEKYLTKCLASIIDQTYLDIEILCMDDGSTDDSSKILDIYALQDERICVIHKENTGYGDTMNQAIHLATGDYIGIVESDDYIDINMYGDMIKLLEQYDLDFVKSDFLCLWNCDEGGEYLQYKKLTDKKEYYNRVINPNIEKETFFFEKFTWNALYRKSFLLNNCITYNSTPGASFQDNGFWFQTMYYAQRVMFIDKAYYYYRQDNPNSSVNSDKKLYCMKEEYDFIHFILDRSNESNMKYYNVCFFHRMRGYLFTIQMLSQDKKIVLAKLLSNECKLYEDKNEVDWGLFSNEELSILQMICKDPNRYVDNINGKNSRIKDAIQGFSHIVIYGLGNYGKGIYDLIWRNADRQTKIDFAVSDITQEESRQYRSSRVLSIEDTKVENETVLIILAVKEQSKAFIEMKTIIKMYEFENVLSYHELLGED